MVEDIVEGLVGRCCSSVCFEFLPPDMLRAGVQINPSGTEPSFTHWEWQIIAHQQLKWVMSDYRLQKGMQVRTSEIFTSCTIQDSLDD